MTIQANPVLGRKSRKNCPKTGLISWARKGYNLKRSKNLEILVFRANSESYMASYIIWNPNKFFLGAKTPILQNIKPPSKRQDFGRGEACLNFIETSRRRGYAEHSGALWVGAKKTWHFLRSL